MDSWPANACHPHGIKVLPGARRLHRISPNVQQGWPVLHNLEAQSSKAAKPIRLDEAEISDQTAAWVTALNLIEAGW